MGVAIKIIDRSKLKEDYQKDHLHREARILGQLRHPNIVRLYETLKATTLHCLVLELASGGELQAFIRGHKDGRLTEDKARPFIRQLVSALHYLHERGVAHRDLKMENIMLDEKQKNVKLVDFGLSITFNKDELMKTHCGSPEYAAPELFAAKDRYGPEIDVWSLGIVMYVMMVGRLPFTTPYTDHYRRQKLVQQMEKGLTEAHTSEMAILSQDCQDMLKKVIEPSPERRLSMLEMELHSWVTIHAKLPFYPFQAFPKDKTLRQQGSPSLRKQTIATLSEKLELKKEQVEQTVGETKSDELSAMYNMMLDARRKEQGLYDIDHTSKPMERRDGRTKRRAKSAPEEKKSRRKGGIPPALVLPAPEVAVDSAPNTGTGGTAEPETRMTSFDFLALCSAPTWLGPERRRSRRRTRSPNPAAQQKSTEGMSVRSQLRRDYMERQNQEAQAQAAAAEKAAADGKLSPNLLSPDHAAIGLADSEGSGHRFRRGSSFKLSRKRARSFGPRQKKRSAFQRSGSMDTPMQVAADGAGPGRLHGAKSDSLATASPSTLSVAVASLAVAFGGRTSNVLQVPEARVGSRLETSAQKNSQMVKANYSPCSAPLNSPDIIVDSAAELPAACVMPSGMRESLTNVEIHVSHSAKPVSPTLGQLNGPAALPVHGADNQLPAAREVHGLQPSSMPNHDTCGTETLSGDNLAHQLPCSDPHDAEFVQPLHLLDCSQRPVFHQQVPLSLHRDESWAVPQEGRVTAMHLPHDSAPSQPPPKAPRVFTDSGMGVANKTGRDYPCADLDPALRALTLDGLIGATGISGTFKDDDDFLEENEVDVTMEEDDLLFSDAEQTPKKWFLAANRTEEGGATQGSPQFSEPSEEDLLVKRSIPATGATPPMVMLRKKRGSLGSQSLSSSGSRSQKRGSLTLQGGKLKTPNSPLSWVVHSPLARIESFHSDDFDVCNSSDNDSAAEHGEGASGGMHILPCFAYKLNRGRKKLPKASDQQAAESKAGKRTLIGTGEVGRSGTAPSALAVCGQEPTAADPLLSCGGDTDHIEDSSDRAVPASKAKVHPEDSEKLLLKTETKPSVCNSVITQQPKRQVQQALVNNCVASITLEPTIKTLTTTNTTTSNTSSNTFPTTTNTSTTTTTTTTTTTSKAPSWTRSFVYFFKRKKPGPRCGSNNNNNDCASTPMLPANHNGCSSASPAKRLDSNNLEGTGVGVPHSLSEQHSSVGDFSSSDGGGEIGGDNTTTATTTIISNNCKPRVYVPVPADSNMTGKRVQP